MKRITGSKTSREHFLERAADYDASASWVCDRNLAGIMLKLAGPGQESVCLDLAVGTGQVAKAFKGKAGKVVGLDICPEMTHKAMQYLDFLALGKAEKLPFLEGVFDICTVRQGLQFMEIEEALSELFRVLKPGGRIVLAHLTAYGPRDGETTFLIQKLRNPARKNFFLPGDVGKLAAARFSDVRGQEYITKESVGEWTAHGAIPESARDEIFRIYLNAQDEFKTAHRLEFPRGDILDCMRMEIVSASKP